MPPTLGALGAYLAEKSKHELWQTYTAQMLYLVNNALYKGFTVPAYADLIKDKTQDARSGREIIDGLVKKLEGGEG